MPTQATACNCSVCHRYGALWAYGHHRVDIHTSGATRTYCRADSGMIHFHACISCCGVTHYTPVDPTRLGAKTGVNLRMAAFDQVAHLPIRRFDGFGPFAALPDDGTTLRDLWF